MTILQSMQNKFNISQSTMDVINPYVNAIEQHVDFISKKVNDFVENHFTVIFLTFSTITSLVFIPRVTLIGAVAAYAINHFIFGIKNYGDRKIFTTMNATAIGVSAIVNLLIGSYGGFFINAISLFGGAGLGNTMHRGVTQLL